MGAQESPTRWRSKLNDSLEISRKIVRLSLGKIFAVSSLPSSGRFAVVGVSFTDLVHTLSSRT